ncbi:SMC-Scp complex subunit ScpB [Algimonas porphyrae]|uniref:Segregation and condensation protein B n=1 Tax=Algimonas porphyrae TaxID=1128113 RepID=A0ABQ5UZG0_9PROT|nr:SMC-Scp complex subunit ScpB [Algimonas porphyrae]GLQ20232.1 segregation and condensation protein B [Algimonas porphyrae]
MTRPTSSRLDQASRGIEDDIVQLTERLKQSGDEAAPDADLRHLEALLFAASEPIDTATLRERLPKGVDVGALLARLQHDYAGRGINLVHVAGRWRFQTAPDLADNLVDVREAPRKLSKAALETLAIIAYHQPVTRAEIEDVRGVAVSKGTLDVLMELGWARVRGRRRTPGRPVTYGTTEGFLAHFNLEQISDLPGREDLKAAGLLDPRLPKDFEMPEPAMLDALATDEDPLEVEPEDTDFFEDFLADDDD